MQPLLESLLKDSGQSRAILLLGKSGWGKFSTGLEFAGRILGEEALKSSNFFCFRNERYGLKTSFFLRKKPYSSEAWKWLLLFQRRINASILLNESLSNIKINSIKEKLDEHIAFNSFPEDDKFITQLEQLAGAYDKKTGIPVDIIRESIKFHSIQSQRGRVSLLGDFDNSDETTQNSALKLLEEPYPNHWLILTAESEKSIIPTILSRTIIIPIKQPSYDDISFLGAKTSPLSTINIMEESLYKISTIKLELLEHFFEQCVHQMDKQIYFIQFAESLQKNGHTFLFLEELQNCMIDAHRLRQNELRTIDINLIFPQYKKFSSCFKYISVAEIEFLVSEIEILKKQASRSVIKTDSILIPLFLEIGRTLLRK